MENQPPPIPPPAPPLLTANSSVAGFWKRVLAAIVDTLFLGAFGWLLGLFFSRQFMHMGGWARLVGFVIALFYFVPLNSRIGAGQTLGKRALGIRVTSATGDGLGLARSFVRACVLSIPFFLNGAPLPLQLLQSPVGIADSLAVFGLGLSIVYLFTFNRRTRQSLHDLVVGSYVVRIGSERSDKRPIWKGHYVVVGVILILSVALPFVTMRIARMAPLGEIMSAYQIVLQEPEVVSAQLVAGQTNFWDMKGGRRSVTHTSAVVRLNRPVADKETEAAKFAHIILENYPGASAKDSLNITIAEGYDIGIAHAFTSRVFRHSPEEWRQQIASTGTSKASPTPLPPK